MDPAALLYLVLQVATAWFVVLSLHGLYAAWRGGRADRGAVWLLIGIWALGLGMRWMAPAGPHDINDRARVVLSVSPGLETLGYGWGRPAFWRTLLAPGLWGPYQVTVLAHATALSSSFMVLAMGIWLRLHERSWAGVLTASALVAVDPLLVRFGHLDAPQIHEVLPFLTGLAAWTAHTRSPSPRWAALGSVALILAATMRPESVLLLPVAALIGWAQGRPVPWRRWDTRIAVGAMAAVPAWQAWMLWQQSADVFEDRAGWSTFGPGEHGLAHWVVFQADFTPALVSAWVLVGIAVVVARGPRGLGWVLALLSLGLFVPSAHWSPGVGEIPLLTRHQLRVLPIAAAVVGLGVEGVARRLPWRWAGGVLAATAVAGRLSDLHILWTPYTAQLEYEVARAWLAQVPRGCQVVAYRTPYDSGLVAPLQEQPRYAADGWKYGESLAEVQPDRRCAYWYRSGLCTVRVAAQDEGAAVCEAFETAWRLTPVGEAWLADHPWLYDEHLLDPVRVGLYRIDGPAQGARPEGATRSPGSRAD